MIEIGISLTNSISFSEYPLNLKACTKYIRDPRDEKNQNYSLESLILIIFSSVISGYDTPRGMSKFSELKLDWLQKHTDIDTRPCAETLRTILSAIKASELIEGFQAFVSGLSEAKKDIISLDGKTMRGTKHSGQDAVHIISAWSHSHGITLGAMRSEGKKNEIKTLPKLIDMLEIKGATVTIDAMGCQKGIAEKVIANGGHYVLQLKANQSNLFEEVKAYHHKLERDGYGDISISEFEEVDKGHGRLEVRRYRHFELSN